MTMLPSKRESPPTSNSQELTPSPQIADVAILTILPESYDAVRLIFDLSRHETRKGYQWTWGSVRLNDGGSAVVVTGFPLDRENIAAATFVDAMLEAWRPQNLLLVDIGGAIKGRDDVKLGDVVTHTFLHYYDYHKVGEDGNDSPRYLPLPGASTRLRELSRRPAHRGDTSWIENIFLKRPGGGEPKVLSGEMLVGGAIQSNSPRLLKLLGEHPKAIAVEMEGVGAGRAVLDWSIRGTSPEFLVIRGMSDYCNVRQERNQITRNRWRRYAATAAAAHAHALVCEMGSPPEQGRHEQLPQRRFARPARPVDNLWEVTRTVLRGRDAELKDLRERFSEEINERQIRQPHVIWGEAGMGKSVLARQIAEEVAPHYAARWWIDASDQLKIRSGLREFARCVGIPSAHTELSSEGDDGVEAHRFLSDLRQFFELRILGGRTLVVLDNVDDANLKRELRTSALRYLPATDCDVLITSQSSRWHPVAPTNTSLKGLNPITGTQLIAWESGRLELIGNTDVEAICRTFGGRPLFLKQAAALLRDGDDPVDFKNRINESAEDALEILPEVECFDALWRETYTRSIDRADNIHPGTRQLFEAIAFLSAEPIPQSLLHGMKEVGHEWRQATVYAALATLTDRSLLQCQREIGTNSYTLHRVISALVRMVSREGGRVPEALSIATSAISRAIPNRDLMHCPEGQRMMAAIAPHVEAITEYVLKHKERGLSLQTLEKAAEASSMLGLHRRTMSEWAAAEDASRRAVELSDPMLEPGRTALRKVRLANIMRQRAFFEPAQSLLNEALSKLEEHGDSRDYAWALTVQARILRHRPNSSPAEALPILYEAVRLLQPFKRGGDLSTLRQLSELHGYISAVCRQLSNLNLAESEANDGLRLITGGMLLDDVLEASDLPDEPLLAIHLRALGGIWRLRGDLSRAMHAHRRALDIFERVYGSDHSDVCRALDSLGRAQREWGDLEGALESFTRAEKISNLKFGSNHAHAGTAAVNCALVYLELNEPLKALGEAEKGLRIYCLAYSEQCNGGYGQLRNEATFWALFVRANALANLGELHRAQNDHSTVLKWRQAHYPNLHAHTASSHYALGDVYSRIRESCSKKLALSHHRQALTIREQVFGKHPNYWVAQSQARLGLLTNDRRLLRLAHDTYSSQLKPGHWRTCEISTAIERLNR